MTPEDSFSTGVEDDPYCDLDSDMAIFTDAVDVFNGGITVTQWISSYKPPPRPAKFPAVSSKDDADPELEHSQLSCSDAVTSPSAFQCTLDNTLCSLDPPARSVVTPADCPCVEYKLTPKDCFAPPPLSVILTVV